MAEDPFSERAIALRRDFCKGKWVLFVDERIDRKLGLDPLQMRNSIDIEVVKVLFQRSKTKNIPTQQMRTLSDDLTKYGRGPSLPTERVDTVLRMAGCKVTRRTVRAPSSDERKQFDLVLWSKRTDRAKGKQLVFSYSTAIGTKSKPQVATIKHEWAFDRTKQSKEAIRKGAEEAVEAELSHAKKVLGPADALLSKIVPSGKKGPPEKHDH